ncbi:hypothetical protein F7725_008613, partial [Dissostichus mawsoni]
MDTKTTSERGGGQSHCILPAGSLPCSGAEDTLRSWERTPMRSPEARCCPSGLTLRVLMPALLWSACGPSELEDPVFSELLPVTVSLSGSKRPETLSSIRMVLSEEQERNDPGGRRTSPPSPPFPTPSGVLQVSHVPNVNAVVVVDARQPAVRGVVGHRHRVRIPSLWTG